MAIQHYEGELGIFDYDDEEFNLLHGPCTHLHYVGEERKDASKIKIPDGITSCQLMFNGIASLECAPIIPNSVKNCEHMFCDCWSLKEPPVIPSGVVNCYGMFRSCKSLKESPVIPSGVVNCYGMFRNCKSLKEPPVIPDGVIDCSNMFEYCYQLESVPVIPSGVRGCGAMFACCSKEIQKAGKWNIEHRDKNYYIEKLLVDAENLYNATGSSLFKVVIDRVKLYDSSDVKSVMEDLRAANETYERRKNMPKRGRSDDREVINVDLFACDAHGGFSK